MKFDIFAIFCCLAIESGHAQAVPRWVLAAGRLPTESEKLTAVYDGADSVYLVGGYNPRSAGYYQDQIWSYSIKNDVVTELGPFVAAEFGGAAMGGPAAITYFGGNVNIQSGFQYSDAVTTFSMTSKTSAVVASLPTAAGRFGVARNPSEGTAYIIGGEDRWSGSCMDQVWAYNATTQQVTQVGQIPLLPSGPNCKSRGSATWDSKRKVAYYFDGGSHGNQILEFNPATGNLTVLSTAVPFYPSSPAASYADADGCVYVFDDSGVTKFDPVAQTMTQIQPDNYPSLRNSAYVYVPSVDRVYIFGGQGSINDSPWYRNEIAYIDFGRPQPTTTTTTAKPTTTKPASTTAKPTTTTGSGATWTFINSTSTAKPSTTTKKPTTTVKPVG